MFKINMKDFLSRPVHFSAFLCLFGLLLFLPLIRPPLLLSIILLCGLVYLSMFFGALFSKSDNKQTDKPEHNQLPPKAE